MNIAILHIVTITIRLLNPIKAMHLPDFTWKIDQRLSRAVENMPKKYVY